MKRVRDERGQPGKPNDSDAAKSDFIAAARRAAQAAASEMQVNRRKTDIGSPVKALRIGDLLKSRRKPILMGTAVVMLALAGLQLGKAFMKDPVQTADLGNAPLETTDQLDVASLGATTAPGIPAGDVEPMDGATHSTAIDTTGEEGDVAAMDDASTEASAPIPRWKNHPRQPARKPARSCPWNRSRSHRYRSRRRCRQRLTTARK